MTKAFGVENKPEGWGLDVYRGRVPLTCDHCGQPLVFREEYIYSYPTTGTVVFHNTKECAVIVSS